MQPLKEITKILLLISLFVWLTACGGGGGGGSNAEANTNTNCVLGSSKIGGCKI